jgi:asparagine synthase (glutamine-hydrolysing)
MLSGMGGDELFLGYPRYKLLNYKNIYYIFFKLANNLLSLNKKFSKKLDRFRSFFADKSFVLKYTNLIGYFQEDELENLLVNFDKHSLFEYEKKLFSLLSGYEFLNDVKKAQILDLYGFLSHNFMVADKSSMRASIEMRVPLATPTLFDATLSMKVSDLMNFFNAKIPLLNILKQKISLKYFNRPKEGFNPDLENIVTVIGKNRISQILQSDSFLSYVQFDYVNKILADHFMGKKNHSYKIYQLLYFKFWLDSNL